MNAQICQASCVESPLFGSHVARVAAATTEAAKAAITTFRSVWRAQTQQGERMRAIEMMADVNERTLKDIGAPEWLIARAGERRHAHHIHLIELYKS